jgi:hypothetical protein
MQLLLTTKMHFTITLQMPVRLSATTSTSLNGCSSLWRDVSRMHWISWKAFWALIINVHFSHNSQIKCFPTYSDKGILSYFICGTRVQSLSAPFSYTCIVLNGTIKLWTGQRIQGKVIPVIGHGGKQGWEMSRIPHFQDSKLADSSEVVSLTHWQPFTPREIPDTHFC